MQSRRGVGVEGGPDPAAGPGSSSQRLRPSLPVWSPLTRVSAEMISAHNSGEITVGVLPGDAVESKRNATE